MHTTTVVTARVGVEDANRFEEQARRHGLSRSRAIEALIRGALIAERRPAAEPAADES
jgi:hypothetical protein